MAVLNVHQRTLVDPDRRIGDLIDSLSEDGDRLWPTQDWPPMCFDRPLGIGADGGHGPVRYRVSNYAQGQWARFRFRAPRGFDGFHEFTIERPDDESVVLCHTLAMRTHGPARLTWPLAFRPLHDALIEDSLDRAEQAITGRISSPRRWSPYVRLLRAAIARRG